MPYETILYEELGPLAILTLNQPEVLNALSRQSFLDIQEALDEVERTESTVRCLMITGAGRGFCSGARLPKAGEQHPFHHMELGQELDEYYHPTFRRLRALRLPVIAAVNGPAVGGGMSLALSCDLVVAAKSAIFSQAFAKIGLLPDSGSTYLLPRLIGQARAFEMMMLGSQITAEEAERWGLIHKAVPDQELHQYAHDLGNRLAHGPTKALASIRRALHASPTNNYDAQLELERQFQQILGRTADFKEGILAFAEKRAPNFQGS